MRFRLAIVGSLVVSVSGCLTEDGAGPRPASIEIVPETDQQQAPSGGRLDSPLRVVVRADDGTPVTRGEVLWSILEGSGAALSDSLSLADGFGVAQVELTTGAVGQHMVMAALAVDPSKTVVFTAEAVPGPELVSVAPNSFSGGDTLTIVGTGFTSTTRFDIGGATAELASPVMESGTLVVAPPCLPAGAVAIVAYVGTAMSNGLTGTYVPSADPLVLGVGGYVSVRPEEIACATFPGAGADSVQYLIAPQSVTGTAGDSVSFRVRGDVVVPSPVRPSPVAAQPSWATRFHDALREQERNLPRATIIAPPDLAAARAARTTQLGERQDFTVCETFPCRDFDDFTTVSAEAKYVGTHAAIFEDQDAPANGLTPADFDSLGTMFDDVLYEVASGAFGAESDIDRNALVFVVMTPVVNQLTPESECSESFVSGFFFGLDLNPLFAEDQRSNQAELFYTIVADPNGDFTCEFSTNAVRRNVPVTLVHEFQHMISYHQHVLLRGGSAEVLWLNEAMSHLSEELAARRFLEMADSVKFSRFAIGNLFNAYSYLENPEAVFTLTAQGTGSLAERGSAWLFLRWMVDQHGDDLTRRLSETALTATPNVEAATGASISNLLPDWFLANWVSDLPDFAAPQRLRYESWSFRTTYQSLHEQSPEVFARPFPLVPEAFVGGSFERSGFLRAGSGDYYLVDQLPGSAGFALEFTEASGSAFSGGMPRLNVIRTK